MVGVENLPFQGSDLDNLVSILELNVRETDDSSREEDLEIERRRESVPERQSDRGDIDLGGRLTTTRGSAGHRFKNE